jgi:hypothetical protein
LGDVGANIRVLGAGGRGRGDIMHVDSKVRHSEASLSEELAVCFLTEERVDEDVLLNDVGVLSRLEDVESANGTGVGVR